MGIFSFYSFLGKYHSVGSIHESLSEITRNKSWKTVSFLNVLFFLAEFTFNLYISSPEVEVFSINTTGTKPVDILHLTSSSYSNSSNESCNKNEKDIRGARIKKRSLTTI